MSTPIPFLSSALWRSKPPRTVPSIEVFSLVAKGEWNCNNFCNKMTWKSAIYMTWYSPKRTPIKNLFLGTANTWLKEFYRWKCDGFWIRRSVTTVADDVLKWFSPFLALNSTVSFPDTLKLSTLDAWMVSTEYPHLRRRNLSTENPSFLLFTLSASPT